MVDLVRAAQSPDELAKEFEPTAQSIAASVVVAAEQEVADLGSTERDELAWLRRENKQLRPERDILSKAATSFARETGAVPSGSSGSWAQTKPALLLPRWRARSAFPRRAVMPGSIGRPRLMSSPMPHY